MHGDCWKGICLECPATNTLRDALEEQDLSKEVFWYSWEKDDNERLVKQSRSTCMAELLDLVKNDFPSYREHVRVKRIQSAQFEEDKEKSRVLQVDFAMAYSCEYQDEVQSALWSRSSVQLFTAALFVKGECKTYLICSDTHNKGKDAVFTFINELYEHFDSSGLMSDETEVEDIIFTDGPSSEFKNKYAMQLLYSLSQKYKRNFSWKYFATSHGKGVVDGVGGRAKSLVRQKSLSKSGKQVVQNAQDFFDVARSVMSSTTVLLCSQQEIANAIKAKNPWVDVPNVAGIRQMHEAKCDYNDRQIMFRHTSGQSQPDFVVKYSTGETEIPFVIPPTNVTLQKGNWCVVDYDGEHFPGEVLRTAGAEYEVSVMTRAGSFWKWPTRKDVLFYKSTQIVKAISPPNLATSRGHFTFTDW